jgi:hypothetical protein
MIFVVVIIALVIRHTSLSTGYIPQLTRFRCAQPCAAFQPPQPAQQQLSPRNRDLRMHWHFNTQHRGGGCDQGLLEVAN